MFLKTCALYQGCYRFSRASKAKRIRQTYCQIKDKGVLPKMCTLYQVLVVTKAATVSIQPPKQPNTPDLKKNQKKKKKKKNQRITQTLPNPQKTTTKTTTTTKKNSFRSLSFSAASEQTSRPGRPPRRCRPPWPCRARWP